MLEEETGPHPNLGKKADQLTAWATCYAIAVWRKKDQVSQSKDGYLKIH